MSARGALYDSTAWPHHAPKTAVKITDDRATLTRARCRLLRFRKNQPAIAPAARIAPLAMPTWKRAIKIGLGASHWIDPLIHSAMAPVATPIIAITVSVSVASAAGIVSMPTRHLSSRRAIRIASGG